MLAAAAAAVLAAAAIECFVGIVAESSAVDAADRPSEGGHAVGLAGYAAAAAEVVGLAAEGVGLAAAAEP